MEHQVKCFISIILLIGLTTAQRQRVDQRISAVFGNTRQFPPVNDENGDEIRSPVWDVKPNFPQLPQLPQIPQYQDPNQQQQQDVSEIGDIIGNRGSFGVIVTPIPIEEEQNLPPIKTINGVECYCVPYYYCNAHNNTIEPDADIDFGSIDVQYNVETSCPEVLDICCKRAQQTVQPLMPQPLAVRQPDRASGCGIRNVGGLDFKLKNDVNHEAGFGEFPWSVAMIRISDGTCLCGGSLIHPQVVLTGTHCVRVFQPNEIKIRAGEWDSQTEKERLPHQERVVSQIIAHPDFSLKTLANDVALLVLDSPIILDDHINTICLPQQDQISNSQECFASGWGKDNFGKQGKWSVILKKIPLPMVPFQTCEAELQKTRLTTKFRLHHTFVCAGGQPGIDTCQGDGGAPLVCPIGPANENRYMQTGCVAWGIGCKQRIPAVYASVAAFRNWIDGHMRNLGFDTSVYTYQ